MTTSIRLSTLLPAVFHSVWKKTNNDDILHIVCKGGRGSGKSSAIAHILVQLIMRHPGNAVCVRKVKETLSRSVYEQIKWAIYEQQVSHLFTINKTPLKIIYNPRGNYIIFEGAQEPERLKSLKDSRFPFCFLWVEELAEFKTEDEVKTITNSLLRGQLENGLFYKFFYSYNPPKRKQSWVNKKYESVLQTKNTYVLHSTYLDNPFIASEFIEEAKQTKEKSQQRYDFEYLGKPVGSGVVPFSNLEFRTLTDKEVASFDNIRNGVDFGYASDPLAFVRWHYDKKRRIIYAIDEIYQVKLSNRVFADLLKQKGYAYDFISSEVDPRTVNELKQEYGITRIKQAEKGPGSVEFGENWLDDLEAIVIDPKRTPNIAKEFEAIDYQIDKDGNVKPRLEDKNNHTIDATRYAFEQDMKQSKIRVHDRRKLGI